MLSLSHLFLYWSDHCCTVASKAAIMAWATPPASFGIVPTVQGVVDEEIATISFSKDEVDMVAAIKNSQAKVSDESCLGCLLCPPSCSPRLYLLLIVYAK
jgi:hypothetical protein